MTATAVKERPILFSAPMVRAILDGRKTQTRRIVKPQPASPPTMARWTAANPSLDGELIPCIDKAHCIWPADRVDENTGLRPDHYAVCPFGMPGDYLWVRETWGITAAENRAPFEIYQPLNGEYDLLRRDIALHYRFRATEDTWVDLRWRPSIHMPRVACRIALKVVEIRVERLRDITEADAEAEGFHREGCGGEGNVRTFSRLWESINGKGSWAANPWVWAVSFKRLETETENQ